ncbi:MAG: chromosome partitioning protein ParB, partial [Actinomycetia bacterium]|nr:chromosome partitioning protein ParB [Actinomycetes bacterium]
DPDPMTQFETFARLTKEGRSVAEIAATFGITEIMVKRSLALGNLLPKIREAYRNEEIDDESIRQLTLASKAQQRAWWKLFENPEQHVPMGHDLKAWLFGGHEIPTEVALFPLDIYSGQIVTGLVGEQCYCADTEQFGRLQNEAIATKRDALVAAGWSEVIILEPGQRFHGWEYEPAAKEQGGRVYV